MSFSRWMGAALVCGGVLAVSAAEFSASACLWYAQPAVVSDTALPWAAKPTASGNLPGKACRDPWEAQSLPVGNGRIGGTVFGGDRRDRVNLNEISLWTGGPNLPGNGTGYVYGPTSGKNQFGSYQPFGNLFVEFDLPGTTTDYMRALDLTTAIATTAFANGGVRHTREVFVSHPDDVLVYSATADKPGALTAKIGLTPCHNVAFSVAGDTLVMRGTLANGEVFEGRIAVRATGGRVAPVGGAKTVAVSYAGRGDGMTPQFDGAGIPYFQITGADSFAVLVSLATDYKEDYKSNWKGADPAARNTKTLSAARAKPLAALRAAHVADHQALYGRLALDLGRTDPETARLPTDQRLAKYKETLTDPELEALIFQYGRYVLIAGSRPGNLPLTLQGIWNDKVHAAWACDYHNNINLQMCYWGAEVANLSECHLPFIDFIDAMAEPLHAMTVKQFGADKKGWTTRISQNPWGGGGWVKWNPPVNAWYALHVWDHYLFTQDRDYLAKVGYPILKSICDYWETSLKEVGAEGKGLKTDDGKNDLTAADHPELKTIKAGSLVSPNGWSHEWGPVEDGCAHDQQLIWELFDNTAKAARILGVDAAWAKNLLAKRDRLVGNRVGSGGYLQEWIVDRPNLVAGHRHTSHLIGVFPGSTISPAKTPAFAAAAEKSLELRGLSGDNRRSWTWPWRTALWARFGKADRAHEMVQNYIRWNLLDNLFGNHPPMQMDGTYGITGGMSEMFVQSHAGQIELLPALPAAWKNGSVKGLRARGNITVDMSWKNGKLTSAALTTTDPNPKPVTVVYRGEKKQVTPKTQTATKPQLAPAVQLTPKTPSAPAAEVVAPTRPVQHFLDLEVVAIIHYGLNTYADKEWGYGDTPPSIFKPTKLDARQWVDAAKAAGIKRIILVCKHHDGFCLWPSPLNPDYTIANTPWKNGKGDLVKDVRDATNAAGLEFAAYLSPWDRHHAEYARPAYVDYFHAQWADLMDHYGPITEIWLDGANGGDGWYGGAKETRKLPGGAEVYYRSGQLLETLFRKSDLAVAFSGYTTARTVTWPFNEKGIVAEDYNFIRERDGRKFFCPPEADTPLRRTWFWHKNDKAKDLKTLTDRYFESVGRGGVLDLGLAPNTDGLLDEGDVRRLKEFGDYIRAYKAVDLVKGAKRTLSADGTTVTVTLPEARTFSAVEFGEDLSKGMRIRDWRLEADGKEIAKGPQVGNCRIARFAPVTARVVTLRIGACEGRPALARFALRVVPKVEDFESGAASAAPSATARWPRATIRFTTPAPATVVADFGKVVNLEGFDYEPWKDTVNGLTAGYAAFVSTDGRAWRKVSDGEFGNLRANPVMQAIRFAPVSARYLKVEGTKAVEGKPNLKPAQLHPVAR